MGFISYPSEGGKVKLSNINFNQPYYPDKLRIRTTMNFSMIILYDANGSSIVDEQAPTKDGFHKNQWHVFDITYYTDPANGWYPLAVPIKGIEIIRIGAMPMWLGDPGITDFWAIEFVSNIEFGPQFPPPPPAEVWWDYFNSSNTDLMPLNGSGWYSGYNSSSPQPGLTFTEILT